MRIAASFLFLAVSLNAFADDVSPGEYHIIPNVIYNDYSGKNYGCSPGGYVSYLDEGTFVFSGPGLSGSVIKQGVQGPKNTGGIITTLPPAPASNINKWQGQYSSNYFILSSNNNDYTVEKMTINGKVTVSLKSLSVDAFSGEVLFEPNNNGLKCKLFFFAY